MLETVSSSFQDYKSQDLYEVIIVNDGSTDKNTLIVLDQLENEGYHVLHQENQGLCSARNNGIRASGGRYILPLDGDDKVSPELIYESIKLLDDNPSLTVIYSDGEYFGARQGPWIVGPFNLQRLMLWNYMHVSAVFRRSAWEQAGQYDLSLNYLGFEDWDLWLSIAANGGKFHYLQKNLFSYRISPDSMVRKFTPEHYKKLQDFIYHKHAAIISSEHLSNHLVLLFKNNKRLWFKLFLRTYFPGLLDKLVMKKLIKDTSIF